MFTIKKLNNHINNFIFELKDNNFHIQKVILFGSYANGKVHKDSDIDLAIWADEFDADKDNSDKIRPLISKYYPIQPKLYHTNENDDPFIEIIQKTGREIILN